MKPNKKYVQEVRERIFRTKPAKDPVFISRYVGSVGHEDRAPDEQSRLKYLGLSMPQVNELAKSKYSFSDLSPEEQLPLWLELYHGATTHEELSVALSWMSSPRNRALILTQPRELFRLQDRVDNWATSDSVSDLMATYSEVNPAGHLRQIKVWNRSKNPWERRQSLVGIYCYARQRKAPTPVQQTLPLIENLLNDRHFFVQKAVGWALRELEQVDPKVQRSFLQRHLHDLSSAAFATATEKFPAAEKAKLKELRRAARSSKKKTPTPKGRRPAG